MEQLDKKKIDYCNAAQVCSDHPKLSAEGKSTPYHDYDFNFPFWFFPLPIGKRKTGEQLALLKITGIEKRSIPIANILIYAILLGFICINARLLQISWDINYKVFHSRYSVTNAISLCLFFADLVLCYAILQPVQPPKPGSRADTRKAIGRSRRNFLKVAAGIALCAIIEPVYGRLLDSGKWYHHARRRKKRASAGFTVTPGLQAKKVKGKIEQVFFFSRKGKHSCLKCILPKHFAGFAARLSPMEFTELLSDKRALEKIGEKDLLAYIQENGCPKEDNLQLLAAYLQVNGNPVSAGLIDVFTRFQTSVDTGRISGFGAAREKIQEAVLSFSGNSGFVKRYGNRIANWKGRLKG